MKHQAKEEKDPKVKAELLELASEYEEEYDEELQAYILSKNEQHGD